MQLYINRTAPLKLELTLKIKPCSSKLGSATSAVPIQFEIQRKE